MKFESGDFSISARAAILNITSISEASSTLQNCYLAYSRVINYDVPPSPDALEKVNLSFLNSWAEINLVVNMSEFLG